MSSWEGLMKTTKSLSLLLIICIALACCACSGKKEEETPDHELTPPEISELAMNNFVKKLETGNYTVTGGNRVTVNAGSPEQVFFEYEKEFDPFCYAFMTAKDETFEAMLYKTDDEVDGVVFKAPGNALNAAGDLLPTYWISVTDGHLFELFYNNIEKPLEFVSNDLTVKKTLVSLAGYNERALERTQQVNMDFDAQDPATVHFTAVVEDDLVARIEYDDLDLTLTFGAGTTDPRVTKWIGNPQYPRERTGWTKEDGYILDNVFFRDYGVKAVPFPAVSTYAMIFDKNAYSNYTCIRLTDSHWTEKDVEDYKELLRKEGDKEEPGVLPNGIEETVFRKVLREDYRCYAQLFPHYDEGLELIGNLYYDNPVYDGLAAISDAVSKHGFQELPDTDVFSGWKASDTSASQSEGWLDYFDYDFYMGFTLEFNDREKAQEYLSDYTDKLIDNGFLNRYTPGQENRMCASPNDYVTFRYFFTEAEEGEEPDNTVYLEFKNQKSLTVEEALDLLKKYGLPEIDFHGDISAKEVSRYYYETGEFEGLRLNVYQPYDTMEDAEQYLDSLVPVLNEQGYYEFNPQKVGSQRQFLYLNEEAMKYVAFDLIPNNDSATIYYEIVSFGPQSESLMLNALRF